MYGLLDRDMKYILKILSDYIEIEEAILFGSRAMGNYKKGSDVDVALLGENVDRNTIRKLSEDLNQNYPLPYFFDVISYNDVSNDELKKHIEAVGKSIYTNIPNEGK